MIVDAPDQLAITPVRCYLTFPFLQTAVDGPVLLLAVMHTLKGDFFFSLTLNLTLVVEVFFVLTTFLFFGLFPVSFAT